MVGAEKTFAHGRFGRVVGEIIARRDKPKAFSAFDLSEMIGPKTGT